jgi:hypothetical protein
LATEPEPRAEHRELGGRQPFEEVGRRRVERERIEIELGLQVGQVDDLDSVLLRRRPAGVARPEVGRHPIVVAPIDDEIKA